MTGTGLSKPFSRSVPALAVTDARRLAGQVRDPVAGQHLARAGERAEAGRQIERSAAVAAGDRHGLAGVEPDADRKLEVARGDPPLQLHRSAERRAGRLEDGQRLVAAELLEDSAVLADDLVHERREGGRDLPAASSPCSCV